MADDAFPWWLLPTFAAYAFLRIRPDLVAGVIERGLFMIAKLMIWF